MIRVFTEPLSPLRSPSGSTIHITEVSSPVEPASRIIPCARFQTPELYLPRRNSGIAGGCGWGRLNEIPQVSVQIREHSNGSVGF